METAPKRRAGCAQASRAAVLGAWLFALLSSVPARGQVPPVPPAEAFPQVPQAPPAALIQPPPPTVGGPPLPTPAPAVPSPTPPVNVTVRSVTVTGAVTIPAAELRARVARLAGPSVPLARIEAARIDLLNQFRSAGYPLTTVTASLDAAGNLRFVVVEARIVAVKLDGDIGPAGVQVLRFLNHLTELQAVDTGSLERWLLLANDVPGVTVRAVLRPSATDPGALTLVAQVSRQPVSAEGSVDNRGYRLTGPVEYLAIVDLNSFTQFGEKTELSEFHTDGNTQNFGVASEEFFVGGSGLKLRLYAGYGISHPSGFLRAIGYTGATAVGGVSASYPVIRSREQTLNVSAYLDVEQSVVQTMTSTGVPESEDDLQVGRLGADYVLQDLLAGNSRPALNSASFRLSQGLSFLGGTSSGSRTATRLNERTDFTKVSGELVRTQTLFSPLPDASVALKLLLTGQGSGDVLPPVEKFSLGGSEFTRGFYSGQATGDSALAATVELQLNTRYDTVVLGRPVALSAQWYLFYDWGEAWQNQSIDPNFRLSSEGLGARFNLTRYLELDVEGVKRNTRLPEGTSSAVKPIKADAAYWRVLARF